MSSFKMGETVDPRYRIKPYQQIVSSCTGALITSLSMTPFDVVKVRLQVQQKAMLSNKCYLYCNGLMDHLCPCGPGMTSPPKTVQFRGTFDAFYKIAKYEGPSSLWSGLSTTLALALPCTVLYFVFYEQIRVRLDDLYRAKTKTNVQPVWIPLLAGATGRTLAVTIFSPLELIRTKMQSQKMTFSETKEVTINQIKTKGILSMWRGLSPSLMRDVPFSSIYWMSYETIKKQYGYVDINNNFSFTFVAGAAAGSIAAVSTLPFDVVKTHQQIELGEKLFSSNIKNGNGHRIKGTLEMMINIYRSYGISGLFAGFTPRIIKVAPACAIMISSFEYGKAFFQEYNKQRYLGMEESLKHYFLKHYGYV